MPELPEVESVCRTLSSRAAGRRVTAVDLHRADVVTGDTSEVALLCGRVIERIERHGKQIAVIGRSAKPQAAKVPTLCVHLGMTGSLCYRAAADVTPSSTSGGGSHVHVTWRLDDGGRIEFRDPRRFGGIWTFPSYAQLVEKRWQSLGPDALRVTAGELFDRLQRSPRPIKAALLDQNLIAGLGNIYGDELLFRCGVNPLTPCDTLPRPVVRSLVSHMRRLLGAAIGAGGSTLRDYVDANGRSGGFQTLHRVYGRAGQPCVRCRTRLTDLRVLGRMTVYCSACQPGPRRVGAAAVFSEKRRNS
jgi:formamidopyrimidine-DNA glycosylase